MTILIVDDEMGIRSGLKKILNYYDYKADETDSVKGAIKILEKAPYDCILLDLKIHDDNGLDVLEYIRENALDTAVIVMTGFGDIRNAVLCMQKGASNYITKPINNELLLSILSREKEFRSGRMERTALKVQLQAYQNNKNLLVESSNSCMQKVSAVLKKIKDSSVPVLIIGETGTGKEVTARYLHSISNRSKEPFVSLNCASLNDNLLESELFGHVKGAYTGADMDKPGRFELAGRGILFLDELGDMSLLMQVKLLRILQEGTFEKMGGTRTYQSHCRIITATNKDLHEQIEKKEFRRDLYYRLNLVELKLPPLRERLSDIPGFIRLFINEANRKYNKNVKAISPVLEKKLMEYDWPGNIRQLQNCLDYGVLFSENDMINSLDIIKVDNQSTEEVRLNKNLKITMEEISDRYESELIRRCLQQYRDNITKTAGILGISRKTLYSKIKKYNIFVS